MVRICLEAAEIERAGDAIRECGCRDSRPRNTLPPSRRRVKVERESRMIIAAKARIWASEGWNVVITDGEGKTYRPADFEKLLRA